MISYTVTRDAPVPVTRLFDEIVAEDVLPKVLRRYLIIPGVVGTEDQTGPWDTPGSQRTVRTSDGRSVREEVTVWERPARFMYRVDGFGGPMGRLVSHALGEWLFTGDGDTSAFTWTYAFFARSAAAEPPLQAIIRGVWSRYMERAADRCVALASGGSV